MWHSQRRFLSVSPLSSLAAYSFFEVITTHQIIYVLQGSSIICLLCNFLRPNFAHLPKQLYIQELPAGSKKRNSENKEKSREFTNRKKPASVGPRSSGGLATTTKAPLPPLPSPPLPSGVASPLKLKSRERKGRIWIRRRRREEELRLHQSRNPNFVSLSQPILMQMQPATTVMDNVFFCSAVKIDISLYCTIQKKLKYSTHTMLLIASSNVFKSIGAYSAHKFRHCCAGSTCTSNNHACKNP